MKAYTDISQSKKLAEILPLESADMFYADLLVESNHQYFSHYLETYGFKTFKDTKQKESKRLSFLPCWSLAALINVIPQEIFDGEYIINITEGINNGWVITYDHFENRNHSYYSLSAGADNLIDACTDIIIKLKERNII